MTYETFEHTADLGLRARAADLPGVFAEAARALFSIIVADLNTVEPRESVEIDLAGEAPDLLLFDWLSELLYIYETRGLLLSQFEVRLDQGRLTATARGEKIDRGQHVLDHEVKAITYHGLKVEHVGDEWIAEVIVDI